MKKAIFLIVLLLGIVGCSQNNEDVAFMPNIETLADSSVVIVKGTILDEGETRNLRRDNENPQKEANIVVPGTDYSVLIEEVLKGDVSSGESITVAVSGGAYKGKSQPLEVSISTNKTYYFFLIPSSMGYPNYLGAGVPFIFEDTNGRIKAVSNNSEYQTIFEDNEISKDDFLTKLKSGERWVAVVKKLDSLFPEPSFFDFEYLTVFGRDCLRTW